MNLDDFVSRAHDLDLSPDAQVGALRLSRGSEVQPAIGALEDYFGGDVGRQAILVVLDDEEQGYLERTDAYEFFPAFNRGFGDSIRAFVPGIAVPAAPGTGGPAQTAGMIKLVCPMSPCPRSPVYVATYDSGDQLFCDVHGQAFRPAPTNDEE
jgi:hypothetical protein